MATQPHAEAPATAEELMAKMLKKRLYAVIWKSFGKPDLIKRHLAQHLQFMIGLEKRGALFASGPFKPGDGAQIGDGLTVLRAVSLDEAKVFANSDPFVIAGARTYDIREWTVMEGNIGITVNFSDGSTKID
ncbi:MAG TPA: YciI family protein [Xanthobacteraceae bacterium]|nr:YciI family protein [Xanthobacteraceae bacterium]